MNNPIPYSNANSNLNVSNHKKIPKDTSYKITNKNQVSNGGVNIYKGNKETLKEYIYNKINSKDFDSITNTNYKKKANLSRSHSICNN